MTSPRTAFSHRCHWPAGAAAAATALFCATAAVAQPVCTQGVVSINPTTFGTICSITPNVQRELDVIDRRNHLQSNAYGNVPAAQRPKQWPLGPASVQSCRFCLTPDRQNLTRLENLR